MRPPCPKCIDSTWVRSKSGGSAMKYYYKCKTCKAEWMQFPPESEHVKEGGDPEITFPKEKRSKQYSCSKCGAMPKKGHICKAKSSPIRETNSELFNLGEKASEGTINKKGLTGESSFDLPEFPALPQLSAFTSCHSSTLLSSRSLDVTNDAFGDIFSDNMRHFC